MSGTEGVGTRYADVLASVHAAALAAGRQPDQVTLVAVSKRHPPSAIEAAYEAGARDFGENYFQELEEKRRALATRCPDARWHFIGRMQSNKAKGLATCHLVHGALSAHHLGALGKHGATEALLQVNVSGEASKGGLEPSELLSGSLLEPHGTCQASGLMCIPAPGDTDGFDRLAQLRDDLQQAGGRALPWLSMGMSADYVAAIAAGATHVRIGTAIFGPRPEAPGG